MELRLQTSPEKVLTLETPSWGKSRAGDSPSLPSLRLGGGQSHSGPRARKVGGGRAEGSQEVVGHRLLGGDAPCLLGSSLKDDEIFLEMLIQLQDGCHIATAVAVVGC